MYVNKNTRNPERISLRNSRTDDLIQWMIGSACWRWVELKQCESREFFTFSLKTFAKKILISTQVVNVVVYLNMLSYYHSTNPTQPTKPTEQLRNSTVELRLSLTRIAPIDNSNINIVDEFVFEFSREFECKLAFYSSSYVKFTHSVSSSRVRVPPRRPVKPPKRPKVHRDKLDTENHLKKKINK